MCNGRRGTASTRSKKPVKAELRCEQCGASGVPLYVHHSNQLANAKRVKKGMAHVARSGSEQSVKLLCRKCHMAHHHFAGS